MSKLLRMNEIVTDGADTVSKLCCQRIQTGQEITFITILRGQLVKTVAEQDPGAPT